MAQVNGNGREQDANCIANKLMNIETEIRRLDQEVQLFPGPSSSPSSTDRKYMSMNGIFEKLLCELDSLDVTMKGREMFRHRRRVAINEIEKLATTLESKSSAQRKG